MNTKITTLFYVKKSKTNSKGLVPIYLRITIEGKRFELTTGKLIEISKWSAEQKKVKGNSEEARSINEYLNLLISKVFESQKYLMIENKEITFETLKNKILGIEEKQITIIEVFKEHNRQMKALIGIDYSESTYKRFETTLMHLTSFMNWKYRISDINIKKIEYEFISSFDFYLRTERTCNNNSTIKYVKNFGKIINICLANGWLNKDPFANYKAKVKEVVREFLTEEEIEIICNKEFVSERLELVRDIFIFSCFTGLAYIDVKQLSNDNISIGIDGDKWIFKNRQKTETISKIPLLPTAQQIIEKYKNHPASVNEKRVLPILSNQKMNAYLKEIADVCGISKELTFHIARHTFATSVTLSNGVPLETVSKMLGHTNLKTTQHYAKILDKKISEDMMILKNKFTIKNNETKPLWTESP
ncbi:site-specific integrase [Flavobacterium sp.]|uniref:site-specific integrase n=1 Tax=Flavobacterium sp. TaxID=239 RepID=UPI0040471E0B